MPVNAPPQPPDRRQVQQGQNRPGQRQNRGQLAIRVEAAVGSTIGIDDMNIADVSFVIESAETPFDLWPLRGYIVWNGAPKHVKIVQQAQGAPAQAASAVV